MAGIIYPRVARKKMKLSFNKMTIKKTGGGGVVGGWVRFSIILGFS